MARVGRHGLLVVAAAVLLAVGVALTSGASTHVTLRGPVGGIVSATAVGPIPFGASPGEVRAWAGRPVYTITPASAAFDDPISRHDKNSYVMEYECKGLTWQACYTLFGFRDNRLTAFKTDSPAFAFPSGVRIGMTDLQFRKREPKAATVAGCGSSVRRLPTPAGTSLYAAIFSITWVLSAPQPPRVWTLYTSSGDPAFGPVFKTRRGKLLCG